MDRSDASSRRALLVMLLGALVLVLAVIRPLGSALFMAAVVAMVLWPLHRRLTRLLRGRDSLSAGILVALVIALVLGPLVWLSAFVVRETADAARYVTETVRSEGMRGLTSELPASIEALVNRLLSRLEGDSGDLLKSLQAHAGKAGGSAAAALGAAVSATGSMLYQGTLAVLALFFFLVNKEGILGWLDDASPLRRGQTRELFAEFVRVCKSVIVSTAATALAQALVALIGYLIAQVPHPVFFFALTFVIAFIPAAGAASVCLVTALLQLVTGHPWAALFLAIYGVVVVGLVDNVLKPFLMKDGVGMHGALIFFALLGGLATFGAMGLLIGPLAVALFLALLRMYQRDYGKPSAPEPVSSRAEAAVATAPAPDSETGQQGDASSP